MPPAQAKAPSRVEREVGYRVFRSGVRTPEGDPSGVFHPQPEHVRPEIPGVPSREKVLLVQVIATRSIGHRVGVEHPHVAYIVPGAAAQRAGGKGSRRAVDTLVLLHSVSGSLDAQPLAALALEGSVQPLGIPVGIPHRELRIPGAFQGGVPGGRHPVTDLPNPCAEGVPKDFPGFREGLGLSGGRREDRGECPEQKCDRSYGRHGRRVIPLPNKGWVPGWAGNRG